MQSSDMILNESIIIAGMKDNDTEILKHYCMVIYCCSGANLSALFCVDQHPTQPHTVAAGGQDGSLAIWDLRQEKVPITLLAGHSAASKFN